MASPLITSASDTKIGHVKDLLTPVLRHFSDDQLQRAVVEKGGVLQGRFGALIETMVAEFCSVPAVDEPFDLEVNGDVDAMVVVTTAGYNADGWKFLGPAFSGKRTYRVRLVELGYVANLEAARIAAKAKNPKYRLLEGQARESFKAAFPRHNGRPIVFGGNEWQDPDGDRHVACLSRLDDGGWNSRFARSDGDFLGRWLWAVVEQDA